ncbi:MAG: citramalate synthase [Firmicutes bacterium HGW-Firmicutes-14]|nr:MAG: citramalate synthase [Firmicutes bacterium HGW-Firmicutes-14]
MKKVTIYDTTLRDGTQGEGISLSVDDKLKIAIKLDKLGVHYIEGGWPGSNPKDIEFFRRIKDYNLEQARIVAFGSTCRPGSKPEGDPSIKAVLESEVSTAAVFGKTWDFHVTHALKTTLEENVRIISESVKYLKAKGLEIIFDAEHFFDGYKNNPDYALKTIIAAQDAGADLVCLCDTNGGSLPLEIWEIVSEVAEKMQVPVGIHTHNDGELAVANSLVAVRGGAVQVQGTINGLGERCGNANLCSVIPNLVFKMGCECIAEEKLAVLTELSRYVSELANVNPNPHQPYVGNSAFAHKGGIHVSAMLKHPETYEHIQPGKVGNVRRVLVSELSGMSNIVYKAEELKLDIDLNRTNPETKAVLEQIKELEHRGFQFEGAEASFELLLRKAFNGYQEPFILETLRIILEKRENNDIYSEAIIKLRVGDEIVHTAAEGNGPVNALDNALRKALEGFYPQIKEMELADYKVRVLDGNSGTGAQVRVLIETHDRQDSWGTVGVSGNIIEASWQALVDSIAYGLCKQKKKLKEDTK